MKNTYETGIFGEKTASEWLEKHKGMKLLETRHRNRAGEIDLIMLDGETVAFIEVKTRLNAVPGCGLMAVDLVPRQATGAALGIVGMASYAAAGLQNVVTGLILDNNIIEVNGVQVHDFTYASWFWLGAATISFLLPVLNWKRKQQVI